MNNKKVLVIDDDDGVREVIQLCLEAITGWEIITADSGSQGIAIAQTHQPDAILLDVMMPYMDGPETFRQLQENLKTQCIPVILLTAKAKISEQKQFRDLGVTGVIIKPFDPQNLIEQMYKMLNW